MKEIEGKILAAINKYDLITAGDSIAVGLSGGKDSNLLLYALAHIRDYCKIPFSLSAITVDPQFDNIPGDYSSLTALCDSIGVEHIIRRTQLYSTVIKDSGEKIACSMCARMRRGILHNICVGHGFNKLALGHHFDDAVETFLMNLFSCGKIGCFSPKAFLSRKQLWMIRPMVFVSEKEIAKAARRYSLPVIQSNCPYNDNSNRSRTGDLLTELEKQYPDLRMKILGAMQRAHIDGF